MAVCLVSASDTEVRERIARFVGGAFDVVRTATAAELLVAVAGEAPDVVVLAVGDDGAVHGPWTGLAGELRLAAPGLPVLLVGPDGAEPGVECGAATAALGGGVGGFLRPGSGFGLPVSADRAARPASPELSRRELDVLRGMTDGLSNAEIAAALAVAEDTVKTHARRLFRKLGAGDRADAVARGFRQGILR